MKGSLLCLIVCVGGCVHAEPGALSSGRWSSALTSDVPGSLFPNDQVVMSDADIRAVLDAEIVPPRAATIAILDFSRGGGGQQWSSEIAQLYDTSLGDLTARIADCAAVERVAVMPAMMAPQVKTVPYMRRAAARFRADLLLIYHTTVYTYQRERLIGRNQAKARCTVEAVLLDVRSGVVVFSAQAASDFVAEKTRDDFNFAETRHKAQAQAFSQALGHIAEEVAGYLQ